MTIGFPSRPVHLTLFLAPRPAAAALKSWPSWPMPSGGLPLATATDRESSHSPSSRKERSSIILERLINARSRSRPCYRCGNLRVLNAISKACTPCLNAKTIAWLIGVPLRGISAIAASLISTRSPACGWKMTACSRILISWSCDGSRKALWTACGLTISTGFANRRSICAAWPNSPTQRVDLGRKDSRCLASRLRSSWPIAGTTGYDFMNRVGGLFVDPAGRRPDAVVHCFHWLSADFSDLVVQKKNM